MKSKNKKTFDSILAIVMSIAIVLSGFGVSTVSLAASGDYAVPQNEKQAETNPLEKQEKTVKKQNLVTKPQTKEAGDQSEKEKSDSPKSVNQNSSAKPILRSVVTPKKGTYTYTFKVDGNEISNKNSKQIVKDGEHLKAPASPEKNGYKFIGWYVNGEKLDFSQSVTVTGSGNTDKVAEARFEESHYVFFMDGTGDDARVFQTKHGTNGTSVSTDVKLPISSTQVVTGWYLNKDLSGDSVGTQYTIGNANQKLYPKIEDGHYVYFNSGEQGTYIEPMFISPIEKTKAPSDPKRPGYTFKYWSKSENGTKYNFNENISSNLNLFAVWQADASTKYQVVFWKQSVNDDKDAADDTKTYDYAGMETRSGLTGQTASATTQDGNKNYKGFHYNSGKTESVTIKGDGTTVLNVYYDRNRMTLNFIEKGGWFSSGTTTTFTGLYEQPLSKYNYEWPSSKKWEESNGSILTFLDAFIFDDLAATTTNYSKDTLSLTRDGNAPTRYKIRHYKQNIDGTYPNSPSNETGSDGGKFTFTNKYHGFEVAEYSTDGSYWYSAKIGESASINRGLYIRHKRKSYKLDFHNVNTTYDGKDVLFEDSLNKYKPGTPSRPSGIDENYEFVGWFKDEAGVTPFDFDNEKMPSNDLQVHAVWKAPKLEGKIHLDINANGKTISKEFIYGKTIDTSLMPTVKDSDGKIVFHGGDSDTVTIPQNYTWIGWATKVGDAFVKFNFDTEVRQDIELYPYYVDNSKYRVTYKNGDTEVKTDEESYAKGSHAYVMSANGVEFNGQLFLGWENGGKVYQPGDQIEITGDMTLTAKWGDVVAKTQLKYDANGGTGGKTIENVINNDTLIVSTPVDANITAPTNSIFMHWNTKSDGKGTTYIPGNDIMIDINNDATENVLYAIWEKVELKADGYEGVYDGKDHGITNLKVTNDSGADVSGKFDIKYDENSTSPTVKDAGEKSVNITATAKDGSGVTLTKTVTLKVIPKDVTVKTGSDKKAYDGSALTKDEASISGLVNNEKATVKATGSQTEVGKSENTYKITWDTAKESNYKISEKLGELEVTKTDAEVKLTAASDKKTYDGKALENSKVTAEGLPEGFTVEATAEGSQTDAGDSANKVQDDYKIFNADKKDVTENFTNVKKIDGKLEVTQATLKVVTPDAEKKYDGKPLTKDGTITGLVNGEKVTFNTIGTITNVGTVANSYELNFDKTAKKSNYKLEDKIGTLTVTKRQITMTAKSAEKPYDGTELTNHEYELKGTLAEGEEIVKVDYKGSQTLVGESANEITKVVIKRVAKKTGAKDSMFFTKVSAAEDIDVTDNYDITLKKGSLKITDKDLDPKNVGKKSHEDKSGTYKLGETITFKVEVKNIYDEVKTITLKEKLAGAKLAKTVFKDVKPGETVTITATYTITEEDIAKGKEIRNEIEASFDGGATVDISDNTPIKPEAKKSSMKVTKEITNKPKNGKAYKVGETITYKIIVENTGKQTIKDIKVIDKLTKDNWSIDSLSPAEKSKVRRVKYEVTKEDAKKGKVVNVATATGKDLNGDEANVTPGTAEAKVENKDNRVETGDGFDNDLYAGLVAMSGLMMSLLLVAGARRKEEEE